LQIGPGIFSVAANFQPGDSLYVREGGGLEKVQIDTVARVKAVRPAFNLLVTPGGTYLANEVVVHNKGCFLPDTPILRADGTRTPISEVRPGEELLAFTTAGEIVHTMVRQVIIHEVGEYLVVGTDQATLRVTREHPFYVGNGTFKTLEALKLGDRIFTDRPNTFFANGVAVHNKGGGCFPAGTRVSTPRGEIAIELLRHGDAVVAIDAQGIRVETAVETIHTTRSTVLILETDNGILRTTQEHPLLSADGDFRPASEFKFGEQIMTWRSHQLHRTTIRRTATTVEEDVYNLRVGHPHIFVADGFVVHNKGGGGFGGGFGGGYHGGGSSGGSADPTIPFIVIGAFIVIYFVAKVAQKEKGDEDLDFSYSRDDIDRKAAKTRKLLEFLSKVDQTMAVSQLQEVAMSTFTKLQQCWQARTYDPIQPLLMPDLYADHCAELNGMVHHHEINMIADLRITHADIVNVRYTHKENDREFTALIAASARDYYIDDRTLAPASFCVATKNPRTSRNSGRFIVRMAHGCFERLNNLVSPMR
jgi:uncharacterized membrane protein YgcG